jgi:hypothetical protein
LTNDLLIKYAERLTLPVLALLALGIIAGVNTLFFAPLEKAGDVHSVSQIAIAFLGLLLISLLFVFYLYFFKIRPATRIRREFIFNEKIGTYTHKKSGQIYCGRCLIDNIESPLITLDHGWFCQHKGCSTNYRNPDNPPPPQQPQRRVISKWMEGGAGRW